MRGMRARLIMKLMGIITTLVLTVITAKGCSGSGNSSSPMNPANLSRNVVAGLCADQEASQAASGQTEQTPQTAISQSELNSLGQSNPSGVSAFEQALGGSTACPTTTTSTP